ncbi:DUF5074 domain-containing protein [Chitinophaga silvatica]|uniref:DUF5074 domain-containing protein n=1 Tax=Chitinophaga silvatica TaxID=2282649 RepID=A0A3E1YCE3_9BACT|nr:DUF5074 domain-containing protein [Chitinophaga silvatica]RFS23919.1 DUF5074 domain-containing protein [Chitinophaga silvatica]
MRSITRKFQLLFIVAALAVAGLASCSKDNQAEVIVPQILAPGLQNGYDTIKVGDTRVISPELANVKNPTFQWLVNGVQVSTDSIYTFTPTEQGNYTISYKIISGNSMAVFYYRIKVEGKFENGFFLINEGQYGVSPGDVNFYRNGEDSVYQYVFARNNPGKTLGTTTEYGAFYNNRLYLISKQGPFVVADASTMKEVGRINQLPKDGNAFCAINSNTGLISTIDGIYPLNLQSLTLGSKIAGINGEVGGMVNTSTYIFVLSETSGLLALNPSNYSIVKNFGKADIGFAVTPDGTIWAARDTYLFNINPENLKIDTVNIPFPVYASWGFWNPGMLSASTSENAVFIGKTNSWLEEGREIYKYSVGVPSSLQTPFITIAAGTQLYGAGFRNNPVNNTLVVTSLKTPYANNNQNTLGIYDATTGALKKNVSYVGFFFPAMPAFNR